MKNKKRRKILLLFCIIISILIISALSCFCVLYNSYSLDKDKLTSLNNGIRVFSASNSETTLYNTSRSIVEIDTLPEHVKNAFIDTEDKRFYSHNGYDTKRIIKAFFVNLFSKSKSQGGSTISQQLVKNTLLTNEKTYSRKIKELILSIKMEKSFSKDEILQMYLNTIYFGSNAYGIENASRTYFNKSAKNLTLNEACCLAGIIKSPSYYSPIKNYENSVKRKNLVAKMMLNSNSITEKEYEEIISQGIILNTNKTDSSYEEAAILEALDLLNMTEREIINNKFSIKTYKDDALQKQVALANRSIISSASENTNSSLDSLSIVANNEGHIISYTSNSNYSLHNLKRQPASTLKPFAVYLPCLIHNILSPASEILDEKINYNGYSPENADKKYYGYVSARYALANSLNIPAVKALDFVGLKKSKEVLNKLNFQISKQDLNLSLALGATSSGVKIMDLLNAYLTLSNMGTVKNLTFIDKIYDENNNVIYSNEPFEDKIFSDEDCYLLTSMLKDTVKSGTAKRLNSLNLPLASKTGTASVDGKNTDLYNITYSTKHTMLTWVANIKDKYLPNSLHSSTTPTDINKSICSYLYKNDAPDDFKMPENIIYSAFDLNEQSNNHRIVAPVSNLDRYKKYDYFKTSFLPEKIIIDDNVKLLINVSNSGASLSFNASADKNYNIYRTINNKKELFDCVKERSGQIIISDKSIFRHEKIEYFIENEKGEIISNYVEIKPKEYLINKISNESFFKKKWAV